MKEVTVKIDKSLYEAADGMRFDSKEECEKYEESARCAVRVELRRLIVKTVDYWDLMKGDGDCKVYIIKPKTDYDVRVIVQAYCFDNRCSYNREDGRLTEFTNSVRRAKDEDDFLLLGENYEGYLFDLFTIKELFERVTNACKEEKKDESK